MKIRFALLFLLLLSAISCGSSSNTLENPRSAAASGSGSRPEWTKIVEKADRGSVVFFIGTADNAKSEDDAVKQAEQDAFSKVSNSFGVSVKSLIVDEQSSVNGEDSYRISIKSSLTGQQIEVKDYEIKEKYIERNGREFSAFVLVSIPKSELGRIQIEVDAFGVWALKSDLPESSDRIRDLFPVFKERKGITFNQETGYSEKTAGEIFAETKKAFYLKVECRETKAEEYNGEFYSVIMLKAELFDLMTGETVKRWNVESTGAAYSRQEAVSNGISKAVGEIADQI